MRPLIGDEVERTAKAAPCSCGGYADIQPDFLGPTIEEVNSYDCGRSRACCTRVFKCRICGTEFIAKLEAPDF